MPGRRKEKEKDQNAFCFPLQIGPNVPNREDKGLNIPNFCPLLYLLSPHDIQSGVYLLRPLNTQMLLSLVNFTYLFPANVIGFRVTKNNYAFNLKAKCNVVKIC